MFRGKAHITEQGRLVHHAIAIGKNTMGRGVGGDVVGRVKPLVGPRRYIGFEYTVSCGPCEIRPLGFRGGNVVTALERSQSEGCASRAKTFNVDMHVCHCRMAVCCLNPLAAH